MVFWEKKDFCQTAWRSTTMTLLLVFRLFCIPELDWTHNSGRSQEEKCDLVDSSNYDLVRNSCFSSPRPFPRPPSPDKRSIRRVWPFRRQLGQFQYSRHLSFHCNRHRRLSVEEKPRHASAGWFLGWHDDNVSRLSSVDCSGGSGGWDPCLQGATSSLSDTLNSQFHLNWKFICCFLQSLILIFAQITIHNKSHIQETSACKVLSCVTNSDLQLHKNSPFRLSNPLFPCPPSFTVFSRNFDFSFPSVAFSFSSSFAALLKFLPIIQKFMIEISQQ